MTTLPPHAQESNLYTIYALVDPRNSAVRYIGITNDVYRRFLQHLNSKGEKGRWIQELKSAQKVVIMQTLEQVTTLEQAKVREIYWIQHYLSLQASLLNTALPTKQGKLCADGTGPKRKHSERIAMLEKMRSGDTQDWDTLDPQMQRYYRRQYPEYFGRDTKAKRQQRERNTQEAARISQERIQRELRHL